MVSAATQTNIEAEVEVRFLTLFLPSKARGESLSKKNYPPFASKRFNSHMFIDEPII
jgi:hypothetical protein